MTLSDPFCVDRYRDEFLDLMRSGTVDIVFANESEMKSLYQTASFEAALDADPQGLQDRRRDPLGKGFGHRARRRDRGRPGDRDRGTGRHDGRRRPLRRRFPAWLHAAGATCKDCGELGSLAAGLCIQQIGPRPRQNLRREAEQAGLG